MAEEANATMNGTSAATRSTNTIPENLCVLVIDYNPISIRVLQKMLLLCNHRVTACTLVMEALSMIQRGEKFDLVISDVQFPEMDGATLLRMIKSLVNIPVIMVSSFENEEIAAENVYRGACDYWMKPVRMDTLKLIWQHVIRNQVMVQMEKRCMEMKKRGRNINEVKPKQEPNEEDEEFVLAESSGSNKRSPNTAANEENEINTTAVKKPRVVWTDELHDQFLMAVNTIGIENAVPKKILEVMNNPALSRENIASHLQKFRIHLQKSNTNKRFNWNQSQEPNVRHPSSSVGALEFHRHTVAPPPLYLSRLDTYPPASSGFAIGGHHHHHQHQQRFPSSLAPQEFDNSNANASLIDINGQQQMFPSSSSSPELENKFEYSNPNGLANQQQQGTPYLGRRVISSQSNDALNFNGGGIGQVMPLNHYGAGPLNYPNMDNSWVRNDVIATDVVAAATNDNPNYVTNTNVNGEQPRRVLGNESNLGFGEGTNYLVANADDLDHRIYDQISSPHASSQPALLNASEDPDPSSFLPPFGL